MRYYLKVWDTLYFYWTSSSYLSTTGTIDINEAYRAMAASSFNHPTVHYQIVTDPNQPMEPPHVLH